MVRASRLRMLLGSRVRSVGVPESMTYRSKNALALELVDEALVRGLPLAPVLADSDCGDDDRWRAALRQRAVGYCAAVQPPRQSVWTHAPVGSSPPAASRPVPKDPLPAPKRLDQLARGLPARQESVSGVGQHHRPLLVPLQRTHAYLVFRHHGLGRSAAMGREAAVGPPGGKQCSHGDKAFQVAQVQGREHVFDPDRSNKTGATK